MIEVVLVETLPHLPGLLGREGWVALERASVVWAGDPSSHPSAEMLAHAGVQLREVPLLEVAPSDRELTAPGTPRSRRLARSLWTKAADSTADGPFTYLLEPSDDDLTRAVGTVAAKESGSLEFVIAHPRPVGLEVLGAAAIMARLRDPADGCPWDLEQDHKTLLPYLVEESYEFIDAVQDGDLAAMEEELGDVLLQVLFHAQVARDNKAFDIDGVAQTLAQKLERRHPHIFADVQADSAADVQANWDQIKAAEKAGLAAGAPGNDQSPIDEGIPADLPALQYAQKVVSRGVDVSEGTGSDAPNSARDALRGEDQDATAVALGDILLGLASQAQKAGIDLESSLRQAVRRRVDAHGRAGSQ